MPVWKFLCYIILFMSAEVLTKNSNVSAGFKKFYNMVFPLLPLTMKFVDKRYYTYIFYHCLLTGNIFGNLTGFGINNAHFSTYIF